MRSGLLGLVGSLVILVAAASSQAAAGTISLTYTGTVIDDPNGNLQSIDGTGVFGLPPGTSLADLGFTLVYTFDTSPFYQTADYNQVEGGSGASVPSPAVGSAALTINNQTFSWSGDTYSGDRAYNDGSHIIQEVQFISSDFLTDYFVYSNLTGSSPIPSSRPSART